ncbi:MAG: hypothetical protein QXN89_01720, partial [Candidatus Woesearchaeota archaeon]
AAICVVLVYLITKEIFSNSSIALIASAFALLPLPIRVWLYGIYIGFWIQVVAFVFVLAFFWLFIKWLKENKNWQLFGMSISTAAVMLSHPQDLLLLALPSLFIIYRIFKLHGFKEKVTNVLSFVIPSGLTFSILLPWFLYVWSSGGGGYKPGFYGIRDMFPKSYLGGLTTPHISFLPVGVLVLFVIGGLLLLLNFKKQKLWIGLTAHYFFMTYFLPYFLYSPYYLGRARALAIFFVFPTVAYAIYYGIAMLSNKLRISSLLITIPVCILVIALGFLQYGELTEALRYEHITKEKWGAYKWIQQNTPKNATIFVLEGGYQANAVMMKRKAAIVELEEFVSKMQEYINNNTFPLTYKFSWAADTLWDFPAMAVSPFKFVKWEKETIRKGGFANILDFDYIFLHGWNIDIEQLNKKIIEKLSEHNYTQVYNKGGIIILGKHGA